ncbi:MAG TPA: GNAT family protein [Candidatus Eremiobacteraceae bacterium]|nr:GNAT family protein [Candidatus Eremiobacteraceae bacterium]
MKRPTRASRLSPTWLVGEKVRLRAIEPEDVPMLLRWINESPARTWIVTRLPHSHNAEQEWAARAAVSPGSPTFVVQTKSGKDIGVAGLTLSGARAELGISLHDSRFWNGGHGTDAVRVLVDGAFRALPLQRIELFVYPDNVRAIRCYEKAGFTREGVLRAREYRQGRYTDVVIMSILHHEWAKTRAHA